MVGRGINVAHSVSAVGPAMALSAKPVASKNEPYAESAITRPRPALVRRLGAEDPQGRARDEMALEIEGVVDGGVHAEKTRRLVQSSTTSCAGSRAMRESW